MSELGSYISENCSEFAVLINNSFYFGSVLIDITHIETGNYLLHHVCLGQELEGLKMLMAEWELLKTGDEFEHIIN